MEQALKQWFKSLSQRDQWLLVFIVALLTVVLLYGVLYRGLVKSHDLYKRQNVAAEETLGWMTTTVAKINGSRQTQGGSSSDGDKSLAQIAEVSAKQANITFNRFQPKGDTEAQLWFEQVTFNALLDFLARIEIDHGLNVASLSINVSNQPGLVNARIEIVK